MYLLAQSATGVPFPLVRLGVPFPLAYLLIPVVTICVCTAGYRLRITMDVFARASFVQMGLVWIVMLAGLSCAWYASSAGRFMGELRCQVSQDGMVRVRTRRQR